ncbi:hypothetical protein LXL04_036132 [Taraxacum kok-saghyz]
MPAKLLSLSVVEEGLIEVTVALLSKITPVSSSCSSRSVSARTDASGERRRTSLPHRLYGRITWKDRVQGEEQSKQIQLLLQQFPQKLSVDQLDAVEGDVTVEEIKRAVWDCGVDKSPGPVGFTSEFIRSYWRTGAKLESSN